MKFFILLFLISCQKSVIENNKAVDFLKEKNLNQSFLHFTKAFEEDSFHSLIRYNFILFLVAEKKYDEAIKNSLSLLSQIKDPKLRFEVLFNLAGIYTLDQKILLALETYQKALELDPKNHQIRVNIEFLFKKQKNQKQKENKENKKDQKNEKKENKDEKSQKQKNSKNQPEQAKKESEKQADSLKKQNSSEKKESNKQKMKKIYVDQLLDRLKQKENQIRMRKYQKKQKGRNNAKDW